MTETMAEKMKKDWRNASAVLLILSIILALFWSYYSSEWWSVAIGLLAVYFFIGSITHGEYVELVDLLRIREREQEAPYESSQIA
jgi:membrane protein YdbS with pleckstrin-like domain